MVSYFLIIRHFPRLFKRALYAIIKDKFKPGTIVYAPVMELVDMRDLGDVTSV